MKRMLEHYFGWVEDGEDGREGVICGFVPGVSGIVPLIHRSYSVVMEFRPIAEQHAKASGHRVRLLRFIRDQVLFEIEP